MHPSASVSFCGHPWTSALCVDRRWKTGNYYDKDRKCHKWQKTGRSGVQLIPSESVDTSGHPRCVLAEDGSWEITRRQTAKSPKRKKLGRNGEIISSVCCRKTPWTSVQVRDVCGRKMEAGELLGKTEKCPKWQPPGRGGGITDPVSLRGHPWESAMCVGGRWKLWNY